MKSAWPPPRSANASRRRGDLSYAGAESPYNDPPVRGQEQPDLLRIEQVEGHYADSCAPYRG
ncbi:MAG: hypothetical protein R3C16_13635 [Hyphomonadaceae bacterium]